MFGSESSAKRTCGRRVGGALSTIAAVFVACGLPALLGLSCGETGPEPGLDATASVGAPATPAAQPSPSPAGVSSPTPTDTPSPTSTPAPTSAPPPTPTRVPTSTPTPTPTPSPTPLPLSASEILALARREISRLQTVVVSMTGELLQEGLAFEFRLDARLDLPDRAHGTFETVGLRQEFLSVGEEDYVAVQGSGFEADVYGESGGVFLDFLGPLLRPGDAEPFAELERRPDASLDGRDAYVVAFRMSTAPVIQRVFDLPGLQNEGEAGGPDGHGEMIIDQESLLPIGFAAGCRDCLPQLGEDLDLEVEFSFEGFDEPVHIPVPADRPLLLPTPEPDDHGSDASGATPLLLDQDAAGTIGVYGDTDFFSLRAEAGDAYSVTVSLGTLPDSTLTLFDTDGSTPLTFNDDYADTVASQIIWAAPLQGTYYVAVQSFDGSVGSYVVTLARWSGEVPPPASPPPSEGQFLEMETVQEAMDAMMGESSISGVTAVTTSTNSWVANPTGSGTLPLYPTYLPNATTTYYYCWDALGSITWVDEATGSCPPSPQSSE